MDKYKSNLKMVDKVPDALADAMGNQMYVGTFSEKEQMDQFILDMILEP